MDIRNEEKVMAELNNLKRKVDGGEEINMSDVSALWKARHMLERLWLENLRIEEEMLDRMIGLYSSLHENTGIPESDVAAVAKAVQEVTEEVPAAERNTPSKDYTVEEIRRAFGDFAKAQGRDKAKGILQELGYAKVTEIPPSRYAEAMGLIGGAE